MYKEHEKARIKTIWLDLLSRDLISEFSLCNKNARTAVYSVTAQMKLTQAIKSLNSFPAEDIAKDASLVCNWKAAAESYMSPRVNFNDSWAALKYEWVRAFDRRAFNELNTELMTAQEVHDALTNHEKGN
jgi:hypothetical protein